MLRVKKWPQIPKPSDPDGFLRALEHSANYYAHLPQDYTFFINNIPYTAVEMREALECLKMCLKDPDWRQCLKKHFVLYKTNTQVLFTGYYQPILHGSLQKDARYRYPIYRLPNEWVRLELRRFGQDLPPKTLIGMVNHHEVVPFYTRKEIDFEKKLQGKGYELAWVDDPVELFFLHVQGSGVIILPNGQRRYVHYAATNGRRYQSIGRIMKQWGLLEKPNGLNIKSFLRMHPEWIPKVFAVNESYIFFKFVERGPLGALNEILTPYYSLATDPSVIPRGAILFVSTHIPKVNETQDLLGWESFQSLAFSQDTGGAIKGSARADIFFGTGKVAEAQACYMDSPGDLYVLVKKRNER